MKRSYIRHRSEKTIALQKETGPPREAYVRRFGYCWVCGHRPRPLVYPPVGPYDLACHEILGGPLRQLTLVEWCAVLVVCNRCNGEIHAWPKARQLAVLWKHAPDNYDLARFNWLRNPAAPNFVEQWEVDEWFEPELEI